VSESHNDKLDIAWSEMTPRERAAFNAGVESVSSATAPSGERWQETTASRYKELCDGIRALHVIPPMSVFCHSNGKVYELRLVQPEEREAGNG
jgi:hypothetical protein